MSRDELYGKFGPVLLEAIVGITLNEINVLRTAAGLPLRTKQQINDAIENELSQLPEYDWMQDGR